MNDLLPLIFSCALLEEHFQIELSPRFVTTKNETFKGVLKAQNFLYYLIGRPTHLHDMYIPLRSRQ